MFVVVTEKDRHAFVCKFHSFGKELQLRFFQDHPEPNNTERFALNHFGLSAFPETKGPWRRIDMAANVRTEVQACVMQWQHSTPAATGSWWARTTMNGKADPTPRHQPQNSDLCPTLGPVLEMRRGRPCLKRRQVLCSCFVQSSPLKKGSPPQPDMFGGIKGSTCECHVSNHHLLRNNMSCSTHIQKLIKIVEK